MTARGGRAMRLRGLIRKEFLQILRDPSSIAIAFVLPVALLLLFGYGLSLDVDHVPVAVVVDRPSADSADFTAAFEGSRYFSPRRMAGMGKATEALLEGSVDAIVHLRSDFAARERSRAGAAVQVIVNGVDANNSRLVEGYLDGALSTWLLQRAAAQGLELPVPVGIEHGVWYNPDLRSRNFLVPGLVVVIMTLTGALLTAMVMAREWERGTMEALLVTPVAAGEIMVGKLVPYFVLGIGGMLLSVAMARWLFGVAAEMRARNKAVLLAQGRRETGQRIEREFERLQLLVGRDEGWTDHAMRLFTVGKGGNTPKHSHPWPHINYVVSGCGELLIGDKKHEVKAGSVAYVPDDTEHQFRNLTEDDFVFICIVPSRGEY